MKSRTASAMLLSWKKSLKPQGHADTKDRIEKQWNQALSDIFKTADQSCSELTPTSDLFS